MGANAAFESNSGRIRHRGDNDRYSKNMIGDNHRYKKGMDAVEFADL